MRPLIAAVFAVLILASCGTPVDDDSNPGDEKETPYCCYGQCQNGQYAVRRIQFDSSGQCESAISAACSVGGSHYERSESAQCDSAPGLNECTECAPDWFEPYM
jgi:hypothetical protein